MVNFTKEGQFFSVLLIVLLIGEVYCAQLSYENYGWWMPPFLYLIILLNILPIILFLRKKQALAVTILATIAFLIIPNQLFLSHKYLLEREEGANITNYIYQQKLRTGKFPDNLKDYIFKYPELEDDFNYIKSDENDFEVHFSVGTTSTSHFFIHHGDGKWQYYDD